MHMGRLWLFGYVMFCVCRDDGMALSPPQSGRDSLMQ